MKNKLNYIKLLGKIFRVSQSGKQDYEKLDIANSNAVFYLCFTLPKNLSEDDEKLAAFLKENQNER